MQPLRGRWRQAEQRAQKLRKEAGLAPTGPIDPLDVIDSIEEVVVYESFDCIGIPCDQAKKEVSAFATLIGDQWHIVLNDTHTPERQRVSLMEEVAHIVLGHPPGVLLTSVASDGRNRSRDSEQEREAFAFGAASLVPYAELYALVVTRGLTFDQGAAYFEVSTQLVEYRAKVTGIWKGLKAAKRLQVAMASG